jgi:hypothetical protein
MAASTPPSTRPMNEPARAAIWFTPMAMPRSEVGKASVRMAAELAMSMAPPIPWIIRNTISSIAPARPVLQVSDRAMEARVNTAKPRLYMRTRPNMSPTRPRVTTSTAVTSR